MLSLYDDYHIVESACRYTDNYPLYRSLPVNLACFLGEDVDLVRIFSLILLMLSSVIVGYFIENRKTGYLSVFVCLGIPGLILFSYAGLLSMSLVILWCSISLYTLRENKITYWLIPILALIGIFIRKEMIFYHLVFITSYYLFISIESTCDLKSFIKKIHGKKLSLLYLSFIVFSYLLSYIGKGYKVFSHSLYSLYDQYPYEQYFSLQSYAALKYVLNLFFPFRYTFYDDFFAWYDIYSLDIGNTYVGIVLSLILVFVIFILFSKHFSRKLKFAIAALAVCFYSSFLLSILPRTDWYYTSRQVVGSFCSMLLIYGLFKSFKNKWLIRSFVVYLFLSFSFQIYFHFSSPAKFYFFEKRFSSRAHPYAVEQYVKQLIDEGKNIKALDILRESNQYYSLDKIQLSKRTYAYWHRNLYLAYSIAGKMSDINTQRKTYKLLLLRPSIVTLAVCLDFEDNLKSCDNLQDLRSEFCRFYREDHPRLSRLGQKTIKVDNYCEMIKVK